MPRALAESLADGQPCPVCGSLDHPQPARAGPTRRGGGLRAGRGPGQEADGAALARAQEALRGPVGPLEAARARRDVLTEALGEHAAVHFRNARGDRGAPPPRPGPQPHGHLPACRRSKPRLAQAEQARERAEDRVAEVR